MPFIVQKTSACPASKPYGTFTETAHGSGKTKGSPHGCFATQTAAREQIKALYANVPDARSGTPEVPMDTSTITSALDLLAAIAPVVRAGEFYDEKRHELIERARALGHPDLIPDNWNANGSLANRSYIWETQEQRETFSDLAKALSDALNEQVAGYCWLADFDQDNVYYHGEGCIFAAPYAMADDGPITIGEGKRVRPVTTYVSASRRSEENEEDEARSHHRVTNLIEYRREKAESLSRANRRRPDGRPCVAPLELRAEDPTTGVRVLRSYASLFNTPYTIRATSHRYEETVEPGAFKRSLAGNPEVVLRLNHSGAPLAATWNNTLRLGEDERGLWYEADLQVGVDHEAASLAAKVDRGDLRESSFAFRCIEDNWNDDFTKRGVRIAELDRGDVSVVTFGASRATAGHMALRSEEILEELRDLGFEAFLEALVEWRDHTLIPLSERAGKIISSDSMKVLQQVLGLIADADESLDEAQPLLADLMGVPNPDEDADRSAAAADADAGTRSEATDGDHHRTSPHLLDSALVDLGHLHRHVERLGDPKVQKDLESVGFNQEHAMRHVVSAQDHVSRLGDHLEQHPSDPEVFRTERATLDSMRSEEDRKVLSTKAHHPTESKPSSDKREESVLLIENDSEDLRFELALRSIS